MQFELTKEFIQQLREAVESQDEFQLLTLVGDLHPADIGEVLGELEPEEVNEVFKVLDAHKASEVLLHFEEDARDQFLSTLEPREVAERFIYNLDSDDAADILNFLAEDQKSSILAFLDDRQQASDIVDLMHQNEGTAGAIMAKELIKVNNNWSVSTCVKEMRRQAEQIDHVYTVYVVDDEDVLLGRLQVKKLLLLPLRAKIEEVYDREIRSVLLDTKQEEVASIMEKYDLVVLPVVDEMGRLQGRITIDDVVDVIKEEADKDYQMASGLSGGVESSDGVWTMTRARLPWLLIGLLGGILGARVIEVYEGDIQLYPEMAFFIPLIAAMGGNVGVQSSALIVQGLANKSLGLAGVVPRLTKEFSVAMVNGLVLSVIIFGYNMVFTESLNLGLTVSTALLTVIIVAALFGTFVPLLLDRYKIDPALATGPFITTVNDVLGLFIYFMIGRLMYV